MAQRWSTTLPRWGSRVRSPSRASFFCAFLGTGIGPARGFGLRSAPVGAKRTSTGRPAPRLALLFLRFFKRRGWNPLAGSVYASLRSAPNACHWHAAPHLALLFLRRRQAKVPDSCLHEMKAHWRPPDIEHEMRDGGGDAGWVVWRLAAYYPLF